MSGSAAAPGLPALARALADLPAAAQAEVGAALDEVAADVVAVARRSLGTASPSAPGDPPADPTGALAASLSATRDGLQATVAASAPYAGYLEYGTRRMAARPFLRPAVAATAETARAKLRAALARAAEALR